MLSPCQVASLHRPPRRPCGRHGSTPASLCRCRASSPRRWGAGEGGGGGGSAAAPRLPSTRALAGELGLARSTIVGVFEQLAAEGYIAAQPGSGYFVPASLVDAQPRENGIATRPMARPLSRHGALLRELNPQVRTPPRPFELGHADIDPR